jgi:hypothetical protein
VIAHLSYLVYLDFRLIDAPGRDAALEQYRYAIEEIVHNETLAQKLLEEKLEEETKTKLHKVNYKSRIWQSHHLDLAVRNSMITAID